MKYYLSEIANTPLSLPNGETVKFELINTIGGLNFGVYASDDKGITDELDKMTKAKKSFDRRGLSKIDQAEYESLLQKKTPQSSSLIASQRQRWSLFPAREDVATDRPRPGAQIEDVIEEEGESVDIEALKKGMPASAEAESKSSS